MKKCQRCGNNAVTFEGLVLTEASGKDATTYLTYKSLFAEVCDVCASMLRKLGWNEK